MKHSILIIYLILSLITMSGLCQGKERPRLNVCFVAIATPEEQFWGNIIEVAQAAAEDLDINLEVLYANRNHIHAVDLVRKISRRPQKPDFLIVVGEKKIGGQSLAIANRAGIKTMLFGALTPNEVQKYGLPRQKLPNWIGQRAIDDYDLGTETARTIITEALNAGLVDEHGILNILGLAGVKATSFSDNRVRGLRDEVARHPKVKLLQVVSTDWSKANSHQISTGLLRRYSQRFNKKIGAIWAANGQIGLGAIEACEEVKLIPGKDIVISGIDWETEAFNAIEAGQMLTIGGGHFTEVAWILVMLHDYHHGYDFINAGQTSSSFQLNQENLAAYLQIFKDRDWRKIDFTRFSKTSHPAMQQYAFSFAVIMEQFKR